MGILDAFSGSAGRNAGIWQAQQAGQGAANLVTLAGTIQPQQVAALTGGVNNAIGTLGGMLSNQIGALDTGYGNAAGAISSGYGNAQDVINQLYGGAQGTLGGGLGASLGSLYGGLGAGQGQVMQGANMALGNIAQGLGGTLGALNQGYGAAQGVMAGQMGQFNPYITAGQSAQGTLANALGLGGAAGNASALSQFQTGPGYQWQVQQGLDAVNRNAAAQGLTGSGNALTALQNTGNQLANQSWNQWLGNLSGVGATGLNALGQQTAAGGTLAGLLAGQGQAMGGAMTGAAQNMAGINQGTGQLLGGQTIQAGQMGAGLQTGAAQNIAASQQAQGNNLSNLLTGGASQLGNIAMGLGNQASGVYGGYGGAVGGLQSGLGQQISGTLGNMENIDVNALTNAGNQILQSGNNAMMAGQQASATELNTLLGGFGSLLNAARGTGSAGTGPSALSNLGSMATSGIGSIFGGLGSFLGM